MATTVYHHARAASMDGMWIIIKGYRASDTIVVVHFLDRHGANAEESFFSAISCCGAGEDIHIAWRCRCGAVVTSPVDRAVMPTCAACGPRKWEEVIATSSLVAKSRFLGDAAIDRANQDEFGVDPVRFADVFGQVVEN